MSDETPKNSGRTRREATLSIRLTKAQKAAIVKKAQRHGSDASTWARIQLLGLVDWDPENDPDLGSLSD